MLESLTIKGSTIIAAGTKKQWAYKKLKKNGVNFIRMTTPPGKQNFQVLNPFFNYKSHLHVQFSVRVMVLALLKHTEIQSNWESESFSDAKSRTCSYQSNLLIGLLSKASSKQWRFYISVWHFVLASQIESDPCTEFHILLWCECFSIRHGIFSRQNITYKQ